MEATQSKILIVEDERIVARDIQQTLKDLGYDAFAIASSSEEAIARASERCPDLVLMDIRIKGKEDGIETAEILKARFGVPIVYLTAHADEGTIDRAKKTEPYGYLLKPLKSAELRSVVAVSLYKHEAEKRLRARERWFSTTLRSITDAVITVDLTGNITFMNAAAEALMGARADSACDKPIADVVRLVDKRGSDCEIPILIALREGRAVELDEGSLVNVSTGTRCTIHHSAAPVVDDEDGNQTLGAVMVFRDVTEQKNLQRQMEFTERLASLGTIAAGVAHEVNNPLAVVVANSAFLSDELDDFLAKARASDSLPPGIDERSHGMTEALSDLQSAAHRIGRIVSDLGESVRPMPLSVTHVDLVKCVNWALRTTAHEFRYRARVVTEFGVVPLVQADEARLGQVIINLLMNALHALPGGAQDQNEVSVETRTDTEGRAILEVRDTGVGIPEDLLGKIFEPFFTTKAVGVGTGLGLSICHGIVKSLGGEISVESKVGVGTRVQIVLPAALLEEVPAETETPHQANVHRGKILIIDDDDLVLQTMKRILRGHELSCLANATDALALIDQGAAFDLILSDIMMPRMTGIEFYQCLRRQKPALAERIVFLTGGATDASAEAFLGSLPNRVMNKPFEVAALQAAVQELLAQHSSESE